MFRFLSIVSAFFKHEFRHVLEVRIQTAGHGMSAMGYDDADFWNI